MERPPAGMDELVEHWTVLAAERDLISGKRGATRLGFALVLKFYTRYGRFPRGPAELPDEVVEHLARQVKVPAARFGFYEWSGSTFDYHRKQIRDHLDFRECSVADAEKLTGWLAANVAHAERDADRVRVELLKRMREERIEPPADGRAGRMVASALRTAELAWFAAIPSRLDAAAVGRVLALVGWGEDARGEEAGDESDDPGSLLALIKSMPGNVSLESMLTEIRKLRAARGIGLSARLFADVAPKVLAGWRARCAVESPSHLRRRSPDSAATLLAALVDERLREITDDLTELLIATVHRIDARPHTKVTDELINAFKRVDGKENLLFQIAEAALSEPDGTVSRVVYPAVRGGEQTLRELVHEYKTKGPVYRRTVQTTLKASYTGHYRKGMIGLLEVLEFRSTRRGHPLLAALEVIRRHARSGSLTYYPPGEAAPRHKGIDEDWAALVYRRTDRHGKQRVVRMAYEVATFRALREMLRCKEIWVVGAGRYRNPDDDLPKDFEARRVDYYQQLRKPLDPAVFSGMLRAEMTAALEDLNDALPRLDWAEVGERRQGAIKLTPLVAAPEPRNLKRIKDEVSHRWEAVPLIDILKEALLRTAAVASDSTHFRTWDQNLFTEWHARYGGGGILVYWHVEEKYVVVHSQVLKASASEVAAMVEGAVRHGTTMNLAGNYVDSHGQSEIGFGITQLLGIDLLPRIKRINTTRLFRPGLAGPADRFARLAPALHRPIRWDLIDENYDQMVKYATAIKNGTASTEAVLSRFTGAASHPAYQAMLEVGKAQRTLFVARYLFDRDLQRQIEQGLNVVESWNRANAIICYGKSAVISTNHREEVEMTALCLRILQASLVFVNTLMLQDVLAEPEWFALLTPADRRGLSPLFWQHVRPYGEVTLDLDSRLTIGTGVRAGVQRGGGRVVTGIS